MARRAVAVALVASLGAVAWMPSASLAQVGGADPAPRFELTVQPTAGGVNDTFTATIRIETPGLANADSITPPRFDGFTATPVPPAPRQHLRRGGDYWFVELRRFTLQPKRTGSFLVGPARMRYRGRAYFTRSVRVDVKDARAATKVAFPDPTASGGVGAPGYEPPLPPADDEMFLHAVVDKKSAYVGEQVVVTWLLFTKTDVGTFDPRPPRLDDWWSESLYEPRRFTYHNVKLGETDYRVAIVGKKALFATRAGTLRVPSLSARASQAYSSLSRRYLLGPTLELRIKPLPAGAPTDFDPSYVGQFSVEASLDIKGATPGKPVELDAGQPIILVLEVKGKGAVHRTSPPVLKVPGFAFGAPRDKSSQMASRGDVVQGVRTYRYWTTPRQSGAQQIAAIRLPYFDPATGQYQVALTRPLSLIVRARKSGSGIDLTSRSDRLARELRAIRLGTTIDSRSVKRLHDRGWFWLLVLLPPLGFVGVVVYQRVRRSLQDDTPKSRQRRAHGRARKRFRAALAHLRDGNDKELFAELARLIYEALEHGLGEPVRSKTRPELRTQLVDHGFSVALVDQIDSEIERCDFARFAPLAAEPEEMSAALDRVEQLVASIRDEGRAIAAAAAAEVEQ